MILFRMFVVRKDEVLAKETSRIKKIIDAISSNQTDLTLARGAYELIFHGYDDDPRALYEIPEVREWVVQSISDGIPWLYFLRIQDSPNFHIIQGCLGYVETFSNKPKTYIMDSKKVRSLMTECVNNFFEFCRKYDISEDVVIDVQSELQFFLNEQRYVDL